MGVLPLREFDGAADCKRRAVDQHGCAVWQRSGQNMEMSRRTDYGGNAAEPPAPGYLAPKGCRQAILFCDPSRDRRCSTRRRRDREASDVVVSLDPPKARPGATIALLTRTFP